MSTLKLINEGGYELSYCDGFNMPDGLKVNITLDGHSCKILGAPIQAQAKTSAYIVAGNASGRSLAIIPISVNPIVLRE